jgi:hypothetical protein
MIEHSTTQGDVRDDELRRNDFVEGEFFALVGLSVLIAAFIYHTIWSRRAASRAQALILGMSLIILAGVDVFLLRVLTSLARLSPSLFHDVVFDSELTLALYLLPTLFAGTGINIVSHLMVHTFAQGWSAVRSAVEAPAPGPSSTEDNGKVTEVPAPPVLVDQPTADLRAGRVANSNRQRV